jgi:hypothetical protein
VLQAHPLAIVGERVYRNPFFGWPDPPLPELPPGEQVDWLLAEMVAHGGTRRAGVPAREA